MRVTRNLLIKTIDNLNNHYLKDMKMMIIFNSYQPDKITLYQIMITQVPSALYRRRTDYNTIREAYFYVIGIMNFLDVLENKERKEIKEAKARRKRLLKFVESD